MSEETEPTNKGIKAIQEWREKVASGEIKKGPVLDPIQKSNEKPKSLRLSVNAFCWQCSCYQKGEVTMCEAKDCPLWKVRPWQPKK